MLNIRLGLNCVAYKQVCAISTAKFKYTRIHVQGTKTNHEQKNHATITTKQEY